MPGGGGGPYPPPPPKVAIAHAVAEPVQASYDDSYVPSSPYVPGTVVQEPVQAAPITGRKGLGWVCWSVGVPFGRLFCSRAPG